ncbi:MAG: Phenylalanine-tRNA ligase beta subunit [Candidatus Uhrbacteria bacterium GW2011_GWE2_40_58]|nr:MAG: Phenylalanine-tRNA ligase beta subunit [Candidatus Uhrbacteria bacterium GW2011_GWF2_40_263]KKR68189.1 MAG: Phenylalanine-tRNA ligase beta subunit [Candidatus Uhrbacteria bacterium GW2011_GWE2_40_58]OGL97657.1 MAG: phenylalanine--tRNA ligase subunit beta [Candidatus Uhrbacteria bacterium RIFOXYB2_FULL_41_18]HCB55648.1 phenylalanine--tRNA ligase subunit beta [Candidatus Uhrbacteria bacterium]
MLISKKWLNDFVSLPKDLSDQSIADLITNSTVEVEQVSDQSDSFDQMIVGVVETITAHPNADKLRLCQVNVGGRTTQIVCGGENLQEGMKVAVALPGAKVRWHGEGDLVELQKTKIRGEESEGMICASAEIGLDCEKEGERDILDLSHSDAQAGEPLAKALQMDDVIFEVEHKSLTNRPDLMGHYGMARELATLTKTSLKEYRPSKITEGKKIKLNVEVKDSDLCPRYLAVVVEGVEVKDSPLWMQQRLRSCGIRPINTIVDITNYVLLETGEPMHAFDADVLGGDPVVIEVRRAQKGEKILCLDEKEYLLDEDTLLITDGKNPLAIAGVMGGEGSGVQEKTTRIIFEAANFDAVSIRKTSQKLALRSESSARFEKSLDPVLCENALRRAVELTQELCPGARVCSTVEEKAKKFSSLPELTFSTQFVNDRLGSSLETKEIQDILERLGFVVKEKKEEFTVVVPSWRATKDIQIVEDVIEEVARISGYDGILSTLPHFCMTPPVQDPVRLLIQKAREVFSFHAGASEVYQYAFARPETIEALGESLEDSLKLENPLASDRPYLVRSLIPNLLETVTQNQHLFDEVRIFQAERVFQKEREGAVSGVGSEKLVYQPHFLCGAYARKGDVDPFWQAKAMVESFAKAIGFSMELRPAEKVLSWQHPVRQAEMVINGQRVGVVAEVDPEKSKHLGIDQRVSVFEINLDFLASLPTQPVKYEPITAYPSVERDLAFVVDARVECQRVQESLTKISPLLICSDFFDVYCGKGVEEGEKSLALHFSFCAKDRTLASEEVDQEMKKIREMLAKDFHATMRS